MGTIVIIGTGLQAAPTQPTLVQRSLRSHMPLQHGIPSHDTFGRVFAALNPRQFEACFIRWMRHLCPALTDQVVAIGGKTVRGSHQAGQRAIHLVSAYGIGLGVVLGQVRTAEKSNETTAIPELLDALLLKGAIVTIDAWGAGAPPPGASRLRRRPMC